MRAFDKLPKTVRQALANASYPWDVHQVAARYKALKGPNKAKRIVRLIATLDAQERKRGAITT